MSGKQRTYRARGMGDSVKVGAGKPQAGILIGTSRLPSKLPSGLRVNGVNTSRLSASKHDGV